MSSSSAGMTEARREAGNAILVDVDAAVEGEGKTRRDGDEAR